MVTDNKIYIQVDNERQEAKGEVLEKLLQAQEEAQRQNDLFKAEQDAKAAAKDSALTKLQALGLTEEEIKAIIGGI
jgi:hypothetical protein